MISVSFALIVFSTALSAASTIPYVAATVRRQTRPRLVTWLTWSLLSAVAGAASVSTGDYPSAAFSLIGTLVTAAVVVAGLRYGDRGVGRLDAVCLVLVVVGFILWQVLDLPGIAVVAACVIDFVGLVPTLVHSWRKPHEETALTYLLIAAGGACATAAAWGTWTVTALAYPVYVALSMGCCWLIVVTRRLKRHAKPSVVAPVPTARPAARPPKRAAVAPRQRAAIHQRRQRAKARRGRKARRANR